jgi:hypothetical protein
MTRTRRLRTTHTLKLDAAALAALLGDVFGQDMTDHGWEHAWAGYTRW